MSVDYQKLGLDVATSLRSLANSIKPIPKLGDDDSIYLTDRQEGEKAGLTKAAELIEREFNR